MSSTRLSDVRAVLQRQLAHDAELAARGNGAVSKAEQAAAPEHVAAAAVAVRAENKGRVAVDALETQLMTDADALIGKVNQGKGRGQALLSRAEARAIADAEPSLGGRVLRAHEIARGERADVVAIARARVTAQLSDDTVFRVFSSEQTAESYRHPGNKSVLWLAQTGENTFTWGRNDLWAERFTVDPKSGDVTVTGEH